MNRPASSQEKNGVPWNLKGDLRRFFGWFDIALEKRLVAVYACARLRLRWPKGVVDMLVNIMIAEEVDFKAIIRHCLFPIVRQCRYIDRFWTLQQSEVQFNCLPDDLLQQCGLDGNSTVLPLPELLEKLLLNGTNE